MEMNTNNRDINRKFREIPSTERKLARCLYHDAYTNRFDGEGPVDTRNILTKKGLSEEAAGKLITIVDEDIKQYKSTTEWQNISRKARKDGILQIIFGVVLFAMGLAVSRFVMTNGEEDLVIYWIVFCMVGLLKTIQGLFKWLKYKGYISMNL